MNSQNACSQCRYWDRNHAQRTDVDEEGIPVTEWYALCLNANVNPNACYVEAQDLCDGFEPG